MIQRLQAAGVMSQRDKQISLLKYNPKYFNEKPVYQNFGDLGVYEGIVNYHEWDSDTGNIFWMSGSLTESRQITGRTR